MEAQKAERQREVAKLERQLIALDAQTREIIGRAPDASKLQTAAATGQRLMAQIADIEAQTLAAEDAVQAAAGEAKASSEAAADLALVAGQLRTEVDTLAKLLKPAGDDGLPPILDQIAVAPGYEMALAAALGEDLEVPVVTPPLVPPPVHWRLNAAQASDAALPRGIEPLLAHVSGPAELTRRLRQIGIVSQADGSRLQPRLTPGQRLVSRQGDIWRWDGFVAAAQNAVAAAGRLAERSRLGALSEQETQARYTAETARMAFAQVGRALELALRAAAPVALALALAGIIMGWLSRAGSSLPFVALALPIRCLLGIALVLLSVVPLVATLSSAWGTLN